MAAPTQAQIANVMLLQLRAFDPNVSAEIGTPERKILDTVAEGIAEASVTLNLVSGGLDVNAKFGNDLDAFVALFGFGRQQGVQATGFITFSRPTASPYDITIPRGTQVAANSDNLTNSIVFQTTSAVTLLNGQVSVVAPIQALIVGSNGNVAANTITAFANLGSPPLGITNVNNLIPTTNGSDQESDAELQVRFKNTVFRNQAGTHDQFIALAVATQFSTMATVIGPVSRYREYIQVPEVDDLNESSPPIGSIWTTALSDIPFAKYIYTNLPYFISNGAAGLGTIFYRQDTDFVLNAPPLNAGDALREFTEGVGPDPSLSPNNPNVTFDNIYTGTNTAVQLVTPGQVVLLEYSYQSSSTRNDITRNVSNCVDVYVNGQAPTTANAILPPIPGGGMMMFDPAGIGLFNNNVTDKYYYQNFRRIGEPDHLPVVGNAFSALFWQPVIDVPDQIVVGTDTYFKGLHYWGVEDVTLLGHTVRARNGIEWNLSMPAQAPSDPATGPFTGDVISAAGGTNVPITGYTYDANIITLQAALDGAKQVTTDVLGHSSTTRYFKLDITVMYSPGSSIAAVNASIQAALATFYDGQYFGSVIQLSDLLQVIHGVAGVDNVRWSKEILDAQGLTVDGAGSPRDRVTECDINGNPRTGVILDRVTAGSSLIPEVWQGYIVGKPTSGFYQISHGPLQVTANIGINATATSIQTKMVAAGINVTVTGNGSSWVATYTTNGYRDVPLTSTNTFLGGAGVFNNDYFLRDEEVPALPANQLSTDTLPGLIIRTRAQNVWSLL